MILNALTFELRIMLRKRRRKLEEHKSGLKRKLSFIVPAQEAKGGQPLAPILGQIQINTMEFVNEFNKRSNTYPVGFPLSVVLLVNWDKTYSFDFVKIPLIYFIHEYSYIFVNNKSYIDLNYVDKIMQICFSEYNKNNVILLSSLFSQTLSQIRSHELNVSLQSKDKVIASLFNFINKYYRIFKFLNQYLNPNRIEQKPIVIRKIFQKKIKPIKLKRLKQSQRKKKTC